MLEKKILKINSSKEFLEIFFKLSFNPAIKVMKNEKQKFIV